jgi:hypothetical protein
MKKALLIIAISMMFSACASRPSSISASYVSHEKYLYDDCDRLATQRTEAWANLSKVSEMQNSKANGDAAGVLFLGIPFSALTGDYAGEVARCKGEIEAIETAQKINKCNESPSSLSNPIPFSTPDPQAPEEIP